MANGALKLADIDLSLLTDEEVAEMEALWEKNERHAAHTREELDAMDEVSRLEASLSDFVKAAWDTVQPGIKLDWSWHYDYIAEYLDLVHQRKIRRLIINIPPRTLKSLFVSVMFPAWVWAKTPAHSFLCASYAANLSTEHSVMRRNLIESEWFQSRWGRHVSLARDQNEKTKFRNNHQAQMSATSVGGTATGLGGNTNILDDGMNPKQSASDAETLAAHTWFDTTWRSRLNNPAVDALIVIEQRTSDRDITGHLLEADDLLEQQGKPREWTHIAIPLECDEDGGPERWEFPISGRVTERRIGDVLQPRRFPPDVISAFKIRRLVWSTQYQQRPSPLEGNMIKRSDVRYYGGRDPETGELDPQLPAKFDLIVTSADCAFKDEKTSDYVCIGTIGVKGPDRVILEVVNKHLDEPSTRTEILRQKAYWKSTIILVEDKANGSAVIKQLRRMITGLIAIEPMGGKMARFVASCGEWQSGNWWVSRIAAWGEPFIDQIIKFPNAAHDDMCFAAGTKVATPLGDRNIDQIRAGDMVLTPLGVDRVKAAGITGYGATVPWNGTRATPGHKVFTDGAFRRIDATPEGAVHARLTACSQIRWNLLKQWSFSASPIASWEAREGITSASRAATMGGGARKVCTSQFGSMCTERRFRRLTTSIIGTITGSITTLAIWSAYRGSNICLSIPRQPQLQKAWRTLGRLLRRGIDRMLAAPGTARTQGFQSAESSEPASNAPRSSLPPGRHDFAEIDALGRRAQPEENATSKWHARSVETSSVPSSRSIRVDIVEPAASNAGAKPWDQIPVYDLQLERYGCFYANGLLVSNCDMMTQACIYLQGQPFMFGLAELHKQQEEAMAKQQKRPAPKSKPANQTPEEKAKADQAELEAPEPATRTIGDDTTKLVRSSLTKPETDDSTPHCGSCNGTIIQRIPGGGRRCGSCGAQWGQAQINKPATTDFGIGAAFRK